MRTLIDLGIRAYESWRADRTLRLGAGLAYYALFTLVPFLAITAALAEPLVGQADLQAFVEERLTAIGVDEPESLAADVSAGVSNDRSRAALGVVGAVSLLVSASVLFLALTDAVNTIWGVPVASGWVNSLRRRLVGFAMVLISSFAIVFGLAVSAVLSAARTLMPGNVPLLESLAPLLGSGASWIGLSSVLALMNRYLGPRSVPWRTALVVGAITAICLVASNYAMGWYLRSYGGSSLTGAFGAVFAALTWVYVDAQIVLAGVQLTKAVHPPGEDSRAATDPDATVAAADAAPPRGAGRST